MAKNRQISNAEDSKQLFRFFSLKEVEHMPQVWAVHDDFLPEKIVQKWGEESDFTVEKPEITSAS